MRRRTFAAIALCAVALTGVGCGSDDDGTADADTAGSEASVTTQFTLPVLPTAVPPPTQASYAPAPVHRD